MDTHTAHKDRQTGTKDRQAGRTSGQTSPQPTDCAQLTFVFREGQCPDGIPTDAPRLAAGDAGPCTWGVTGVRGATEAGRSVAAPAGRSPQEPLPAAQTPSSLSTVPMDSGAPKGAPQWCPPRSPLYLRLRGNPWGTGGRGAAPRAPAGRCRWRGGCRRSSGNPAGWPGAPWCGCGGTHLSGHPQSRHCPVPLGGNCWVSTKPEPLLWGVSTPPSRWPCSASLAQYNPRFPSTIPDFPAWPQLTPPWDPSPRSAPSRTRTPTGSSFLPPSLNWKGATFCTGKLGEPTPLQQLGEDQLNLQGWPRRTHLNSGLSFFSTSSGGTRDMGVKGTMFTDCGGTGQGRRALIPWGSTQHSTTQHCPGTTVPTGPGWESRWPQPPVGSVRGDPNTGWDRAEGEQCLLRWADGPSSCPCWPGCCP